MLRQFLNGSLTARNDTSPICVPSLLQHVLKDNVVYHGLAGHYFLQDIPHVLKVRIIADIEDRVEEEEMKRENISAAEAPPCPEKR